MPFIHTWNYIQNYLRPGTAIDNWAKYSGLLGDQFTVTRVTPNEVEVDAPNAKNIQHVRRDDFERVYDIWDQYVAGDYPRHWIRDFTRVSKFVISILKWVENNNGGMLP
jgi:hypothetical protein